MKPRTITRRLLLGLQLLVASPGVAYGLATRARSGGPAGQDADPAALDPASEPVETWWNEEWARFVGMEGSWATDTSSAHTVIRPEGRYCRVDLLARLSGRLHSYGFGPEGEIVLAHGWIIISPDRRCSISASVVGAEAELQATRGVHGSEANQSYVESFELHGLNEWKLYSPSRPSLLFLLACPLTDSGPRNSIVINRTWGEVRHVPEEARRVLTVGLRQVGEPGTPYFHTVVEALAYR